MGLEGGCIAKSSSSDMVGTNEVPTEEANAPLCKESKPMKLLHADSEYECDICHCDIKTNELLFDCRKCDFSICSTCHKGKLSENKACAPITDTSVVASSSRNSDAV